jgi:CBS domain-containing protein
MEILLGKQPRRLQMAQSVREIMTPNPTTVRPESPVTDAVRLMGSEDVGSLPVVDDDRLVGVVTDRDIALRIVGEGKDPGSATVADVQSGNPVTVAPDQDVQEALNEMARHQVRRLPVVEGDRLVGVVAQADVAREVGDSETGRVVEEISE